MIDLRRREEGQVYPALLLAIIGGLVLAMAFIGLQNLLDQTDRANTASDAAALAVGQQFRDDTMNSLANLDPGDPLGSFIGILKGAGAWDGAETAAQTYADANGADVTGVDFQHDALSLRWEWTVTTQQKDTVHGGDQSAQSTSTSTVAVDLTGLCNGFSGIDINGQCVSAAAWLAKCVAPTASPSASPTDTGNGNGNGNGNGKGNGNGPSATPSPSFQPAPFCGTDPASLLQWNIHLVSNSS